MDREQDNKIDGDAVVSIRYSHYRLSIMNKICCVWWRRPQLFVSWRTLNASMDSDMKKIVYFPIWFCIEHL